MYFSCSVIQRNVEELWFLCPYINQCFSVLHWSRYEVQEEDSERMNLPVYFRERHCKQGGGYSSGTMLFGQPLLITVPRNNLSIDTLYQKVLERIG